MLLKIQVCGVSYVLGPLQDTPFTDIFFLVAFLLFFDFGFNNCSVKMSKRVTDMPVGMSEKKKSKYLSKI